MKKIQNLSILLLVVLAACSPKKNTGENTEPAVKATPVSQNTGEWVSLFDGKTLDGWKAGVNNETFSVEDGAIKVHGKRSHLFYVGDVNGGDFKNFEFKAQVMTKPGSNSGIYFHTEYQEDGWPEKGYEVQVNNTHTDWKKTGGLYDVADIRTPPSVDDEWYTEHIIVRGKNIITIVKGDTLVNYTEPENVERPDNHKYRVIDHGTFALQGHDPKSIVYFKDIMVKVLPD
ncbi:MAG: family 16 glycoside hydrolase [Bacteroidota bacterium]